MATSKSRSTLPQVDKEIFEYHRLLKLSPRSDPRRPTLLRQLAALRNNRFVLSDQKGDLDKSIVHLTEAILLPFQPSQDVVHMFFQLASVLLSRFSFYERPKDIKSSVKYFRLLRTNFRPLEAFDIPHNQLTLRLVRALPFHSASGPGDTIQNIEEMATLTHELLSSDIPMNDLIHAIKAFSAAVTNTFHLDDAKAAKLPPEKVTRVLREVESILPDSHTSHSEVEFTLPQLEKEILKYGHLLASSPRSDPCRPTRLRQLAALRNNRFALSHQKSDLDNSITHHTEAVLLPLRPTQSVVHMFFQLASILLSRYVVYKQPQDVKSSAEYLRFLRINFHPLEAFGIRRGQLTSRLLQALAENSVLGSGNTIQEMEEMAALIPEVLDSGVSTPESLDAITAVADAVTESEMFRRRHTQQFAERVVQMLREATILKPDSHDVSYALASCLADRFQATQEINDYEEAIAIADKIIATHSPRDSLTLTQRNAIGLIQVLVVSRSNSYSGPEYLEDAIHRFRTLLYLPSLPDQDRTDLVDVLDNFERQRFSYFGVTGNSGESPSYGYHPYFVLQIPAPHQWSGGPEDDPGLQMVEKVDRLKEILTTVQNGKITDVEVAVERSRTLLPLQYSNDRFSYFPAIVFADILFRAYLRTNRLVYLNEAITTHRDLRKVSAPKAIHFQLGVVLLRSVIARCNLFHRGQDSEEAMQLFPEVVNDGSAAVFRRFKISYGLANTARLNAHPSILTAYEKAMSLMQETLVFSPTLHIQHFRLADALMEAEELPSEYASYQIETGQFEQAIETLERGRALLWSEMRGLRTTTDQLRAADPTLADKLVDINHRLESVTMSVAESESEEMDSIGRLVAVQRRLLEQRDTLIFYIRSFPGFGDFLKPPLFDALNSAAAHGPVIIVNQSKWRSDIVILHKDSPPSVISTPFNFHDRANRLKTQLLRSRKESGLDSRDYDLTLASILSDLYKLVGEPVINRLRQLEVPENSRVWWCPTSAFCSLPLHAMGPIPSNDGKERYFLDLYVTSYTPTLSALVESQKLGLLPETFDKPSLLLVARPDTLPGAWEEIGAIQAAKVPETTLISATATPRNVMERLRDHQFAHFVCHGILETGKPFDALFELHGDNLTLLDIVRSQLPAAEFAFLSACHTAELTEDSIADEGLHLTAAMQYCGFRSVVGTMWAMADTDGADLSKHFYKSIFSDRASQKGVPYYERSAKALQFAVKKLRRKRGITLERWVNFVHYGA
ncbi:CHAT domain-containing protein [Lactarius indigo]|nr:CHAT domain-containing protein [Lactarius indigo]